MAGKKGETSDSASAAEVTSEAKAEPITIDATAMDRRVLALEQALDLLGADVTELRHKINDLSEQAEAMTADQRACLSAFADRLDKLHDQVRRLRPLPGNEPVLTQEELRRLIAEHRKNPASEGPVSPYAGKPLYVVTAAAFNHGSIGALNKGSVFLVKDNADLIVDLVGRGLMLRHYTQG